MKSNFIYGGLFGLATGDALGVPVEFKSRASLVENPVINMREYGTHHQPKGTWSDDSSLSFCLGESLSNGYSLNEIASFLLLWYSDGFWTPHGSVFDIGFATRNAILRIPKMENPALCGGLSQEDNGNGSLMRILPLAFYLAGEKNLDVVYERVKEVSSITHAHFRSVFACFIYIVYTLELLKGLDKWTAYFQMKRIIDGFIANKDFNQTEIALFDRILNQNINEFNEYEIASSGYVLHTLEASLWCLLNTDSYRESVLMAVNLGEDTDTTGAVCGGLAGILYGINAIPLEWRNVLARKNDIEVLCHKLTLKYSPEK